MSAESRDAEQLRLLGEWLAESFEGVCETFSLPANASSEAPADFSNIAVIGFAGDMISGTLGVAADWGILRSMMTALGQEDPSDVMMLDCLGEIANQVLGRIKNTLCSYSVDVTMTPPMVVRGLRICIDGTRQDVFLRQDLDTGDGVLSAWLDAHRDESLEFVEPTPGGADVAQEGDMMLFF